MNANIDCVPERGHLEQRISRAEARMNAAKTSQWKHLWWGVMARQINARNAMRTTAEVRAIEKARGLR